MCPSFDGNVNNYGDPNNVRNCYLVGLTDLYGALDYVRDKVAGYLNSLVAIGVAGIRIDAAKHMWPLVSLSDFHSGLNFKIQFWVWFKFRTLPPSRPGSIHFQPSTDSPPIRNCSSTAKSSTATTEPFGSTSITTSDW